MAFTPDQIEEIKRLAREEIDDLRDARDSDIRVTNRLPSPSDLGPSGALQWSRKDKGCRSILLEAGRKDYLLSGLRSESLRRGQVRYGLHRSRHAA
jgi:hypothetical protein